MSLTKQPRRHRLTRSTALDIVEAIARREAEAAPRKKRAAREDSVYELLLLIARIAAERIDR